MPSTEGRYENLYIKADKVVAKTDAPSNITTAGAATYTAAQILGGIILRDPSGSSRTDVLPTAALLLECGVDLNVGDTLAVRIINTADAAETITISEGSGGAFDTAQPATSKDITQNTSKMVYIRITGVSTPAYKVYM